MASYSTSYHSSSTLIYKDVKGITEQSALTAITQNQNIAEVLKQNLVNGVLAKSRAMYRYGKRHEDDPEKGYYLGLPSGSLGYTPLGRANTVQLVLEREIDSLILVKFYVLDKAFSDHYAWEHMQANYGWEQGDSLVPNPPFDPVGEEVHFKNSTVTGTDEITITYSYGTSEYVEVVSTISSLKMDKLYYYVNYYELDDKKEIVGELQYWRYEEDLGIYPDLDIPADEEQLTSRYYPIVPLRQDSVDLTDVATRNEGEYKSSKQCLKYLGIDIDELVSGVNESPDIDDVDHAYVMLGVDLASNVTESKEYLFNFFNRQRASTTHTKSDYEYWLKWEQAGPSPITTLKIQDANFNVEISWAYIENTPITGSIGEVGTVTVEQTEVPNPDGYEYTTPIQYLHIRKQVTTNTYFEIEIAGLLHKNYIYGANAVVTDAKDAFDEENELQNFIIPLDAYLSRDLGTIKAHDLIYDAVRIVFNTRIRTKLKWYQTTAFKIIITIIAIVYAVWTGDYGDAMTLIGMLEVAAITIVKMIISNLLMGAITQMLTDVIGEELALLVAIVATMAGMGFTAEGFSFTGTNAATVYAGVTQAIGGMGSIYFTSEMEKLQEEMVTLKEEREEFEELYSNNLDDPLSVLGLGSDYTYTYDVVKDSPSYYYTRTIHAGNISTLVLSGAKHYVDSQVRLDLPHSPIRTRVS